MPLTKKKQFDPKLLASLPIEQLIPLFAQMKETRTALENMAPKEREYPDNPVDFAQQVLGLGLWGKQAAVAQSVLDNKLTVASSGHGVGKSLIAAAIVGWWLSYYKDDAKVITIAPTNAQLEGVLWQYIRGMVRRAGLPGHCFETPRWEARPGCFARGLSPKKATAEDLATLQGYHAKHLLIILDEAAGLPRLLWEAVQGLIVGENNKVLAIGNPIEQSGPFWEACTNKNWNYIQISCLEHPNVVERREIYPGAVSWDWVDAHVSDWCTPCDDGTAGSFEWEGQSYLPLPIFQARVLGIAPEMGDDQLIRLSWIQEAEQREVDEAELKHAECLLAFDPAPRGGDDNAMCVRKGPKVWPIERRKGYDTISLAAWVAQRADEYGADRVIVDDAGSGVGVTDQSRALGLSVQAVNFGSQAHRNKVYVNLRSESYWKLREALRLGRLALSAGDQMLAADLTAVKFTYDPVGRVQLESKDEIKKRIGRSPDSGDALAMTFSPVGADDYDTSDNKELQARLAGKRSGYAPRWRVGRGGVPSSRWRVT